MRPFIAATSGESQVKLTPITRKISKAKKGVPVHNCDQCPKVNVSPVYSHGSLTQPDIL
jgi:hypothetical protein